MFFNTLIYEYVTVSYHSIIFEYSPSDDERSVSDDDAQFKQWLVKQ